MRLRCLGGLSLARDGQAITGLATQPRRLALLALLAWAGDKGLRRERLIAYLWPDADDERGRRSLTQALYAIRRELDDEDAIVGTHDLRLNPDRIATDVGEFRRAIAEGDFTSAIAAYQGPFLDGFWLAGFPEFERWIEEARTSLTAEYFELLERLATKARRQQDAPTAVSLLKRRAAAELTNSRVAVSLMDAMVAANDRVGALRHAEIFETVLQSEFGTIPDGETAAFIAHLRKPPVAQASTAALAPSQPAPRALPVERPIERLPKRPMEVASDVSPTWSGVERRTGAPVAAVTGSSSGSPASAIATRRVWTVVGLAVIVMFGGGLLWRRSRGARTADQVVAVGRVTGAVAGPAPDVRSLSELLATNLARVGGLRVLSSARIAELVGADTAEAATVSAARDAGATDLIEGTVYDLKNGRLRLDLRRVDLASGRIREAHRVEGADLFALVDSGTAKLVPSLGAAAPSTSITDVTTSSLDAYQLYSAGLRQYYAGDIPAAERLFAAALREDPQFAMAAFYYSRASDAGWTVMTQRLDRALQLSTRASDRERLLIRAGWASTNSSPELAAIADTLVARYPDDAQGYFTRALGAAQANDRAGEVAALRRVIAMDSVGLARGRPGCVGCDAMGQLIQRYLEMDSAMSAIAEARRWTRLQPRSVPAWRALASAYEGAERNADAFAAWTTAASIDSTIGGSTFVLAQHWIRTSAYARADSALRDVIARVGRDSPDSRDARWYLAISLRQQGRLQEALGYAREYRSITRLASPAAGSITPGAVLEAQIQFELGRPRVAAAMFDSVSRWRIDKMSPSNFARNMAWNGTHVADAYAAAGDTVPLALLEDTIRVNGARSAFPRDRLLYYHVHGLRLIARGDHNGAVAAFRAATWSPVFGHSRTNALLAQTLLVVGRPREAVAALQPALRGSIEASNLYLSRTELHEALAHAWEAAGVADSARVHYAIVARDWSSADALLQSRRSAALQRAGELRTR